MKKIMSLILTGIIYLYCIACSSNTRLMLDDELEQESVRITLNSGQDREGIVLKQTPAELIYIDAKSHNKETLSTNDIREINKSIYVYDYSANPIPESEIKEHKSARKTWLYGGGGFLLGAAAGIGTGLLIIAADSSQTTLANITIGVMTVAGATYFGLHGADYDYQDAIYQARMARYEKEKKVLEAEKEKLEELKKEKEELLKKKQEKEKP